MLLKNDCLHYKNKACKACKACLACKKHTNNTDSRNVTMTNRLTVQEYYKTNMLTYCLECKKNTENIDAKMTKNKNGRFVLSSKCDVCGSKKCGSQNL